MKDIKSVEVFEYDGHKYVEIITADKSELVEQMNRLLPLEYRKDTGLYFLCEANVWDVTRINCRTRKEILRTLSNYVGIRWGRDKYKQLEAILKPIVMDALNGNLSFELSKKKCECPIDVLMNQGCQCGGE